MMDEARYVVRNGGFSYLFMVFQMRSSDLGGFLEVYCRFEGSRAMWHLLLVLTVARSNEVRRSGLRTAAHELDFWV